MNPDEIEKLNVMKKFEGKWIVRIRPKGGDRSYMDSPILVMKVDEPIFYYKKLFFNEKKSHTMLMPADYCEPDDWKIVDSHTMGLK